MRTRLRRFAVNELEADASEIDLRQRTALARPQRLAIDEDDAALLQSLHGLRNVGRAEADAQELLVPFDEIGAGRRLDQLDVEVTAGASQQRSLRKDADEMARVEPLEAEERRVEIGPVVDAIAEDRLHDAEPVQAEERRRMAVDAWRPDEIDVVNRELVDAVDEMDQAVAGAVDAGNVQLHFRGARRHVPRAEFEGTPVRVRRVAHLE